MTNLTITHPLSPSDAQAMDLLRTMLAGAPRLSFEPASRPAFDAIIGQAPAPEGVLFEQATVGGVPGWWARPQGATDGSVLLYLHGGGYVIGSAGAYRHFVGHIAKAAKAAAFIADYALTPERPFPAAPEDARALHEGLRALGYSRIAVAGDSAGGGLALALAAGAPRGTFAGLVALSPWIDLNLTGESMATRADADPILSRQALAAAVPLYLGTHGANDPRLPSLPMDLSTLPPVRIHVGDAEVLLDDARRFAQQAASARLDAEVHVWDGMTHVFPSSFAMLEAGAAALDAMGTFLAERLAPKAPRARRVLVLGATGGTGRAIVRRLRETGDVPVALVRSPDKARDLDAEIVQGDARDPAALDRALEGVDAVVSALGTPASPFREVTALSTATKVLVTAMRRKGVRRLVAITGMGAGDSRGHGGALFDRVLMPLLLRKVYADKDRQEAIIAGSGLDWMIVRPAVLNDKPKHGAVRALLDLSGFQGGTIARADVADFVVDQVGSDAYLGQKPLIAW
ncbi:NAD-dependent epimerase/dehydratase family protein [Rubellimicrobium roseum]|uniref:NAD-dependent epimerase/dehydratase family protein n=2 Tax=Rubellimicrobium roseum TaxID=687525 RepID=A0A5C4N5N8_9RHOB|nr:NAD-dependent epimerase/dehydratase family protein [Rubellimicrobium roseum]